MKIFEKQSIKCLMYCMQIATLSFSGYLLSMEQNISTKLTPELLAESALELQLPLCSTQANKDADEHFDRVHEHLWHGDYESALVGTVDGIRSFPDDFAFQCQLATLLADYASSFSGDLKRKMIAASKQILEKLKREVDRQEKRMFFWFMNEYNYRFGKYREQYELGVEKAAYYFDIEKNKTRAFWSYYCQGVGAANYAKELLLKGNTAQALLYAQRAVVSWAQYFSVANDNYTAYVHYAIALGILGYKQEMMEALSHSADLIEKDLTFIKFKEVQDFVEDAERKGLIQKAILTGERGK